MVAPSMERCIATTLCYAQGKTIVVLCRRRYVDKEVTREVFLPTSSLSIHLFFKLNLYPKRNVEIQEKK